MSVGSAGCESSRHPCSAPGTAGSHGHGGGAAPRMGPASLVLPGAGEACCWQHTRAGRLPSCSALPQRPRKEVVAFLREEKGSGAASAGQPATLSAHCALPGLGCSCRLPRVHELPCPALLCEVRSGREGHSAARFESWEGAKTRWDGVWDGGGLTARGFVAVLGCLLPWLGVTLVAPRLESCRQCPGLRCHGAGAVGPLLGALL